MAVYYFSRIICALATFAGIVLGALIICVAAEEIERMREKRGSDE